MIFIVWTPRSLPIRSRTPLFTAGQTDLQVSARAAGNRRKRSNQGVSALGFYPVDPSSPVYIMGSPIFDRATIHMGNGKEFVIIARNNSATNMYIQSATLNGKPRNKPWFSQADIADGANLVLTMGPQPNPKWGSAVESAPPSMTPVGQ
jgi:putative alpha-1,2-mannosidase